MVVTSKRPKLSALIRQDEVSAEAMRSDLLMAVVLCCCTAFWGDLFGAGAFRPDYIASVLTSIMLVMPLALRRSNPLLMLGLMTFGGFAQFALVTTPTWALISVPFAVYSVARQVGTHASRSAVVIGGLAAVLGPYRWFAADPTVQTFEELMDGYIPVALLCVAWVLIPYLLGRRDRENAIAEQDRTIAAIQRYESELARREEQARMAETTARNEIARELHDVVAHSLSVIIVQANGGKALARKKPEAAIEVLETIADTGREALTEMRRIVGVLRADPADQAEYEPSPGLTDIPALVHNAGERVNLISQGTQPEVTQVIGLTVYRLVQEALTNFLKHAGPEALASVIIEYTPDSIDVQVIDNGGKGQSLVAIGQTPSGGFGLKGMQERVASLGGQLTAKPSRQGGFVVHAVIPVKDFERPAAKAAAELEQKRGNDE